VHLIGRDRPGVGRQGAQGLQLEAQLAHHRVPGVGVLEHPQALDVVLQALTGRLLLAEQDLGLAPGLGSQLAHLGDLVGRIDGDRVAARGGDLRA
jgi:hypothetical protein